MIHKFFMFVLDNILLRQFVIFIRVTRLHFLNANFYNAKTCRVYQDTNFELSTSGYCIIQRTRESTLAKHKKGDKVFQQPSNCLILPNAHDIKFSLLQGLEIQQAYQQNSQ